VIGRLALAWGHLARCEAGSMAVETALVGPVLITLALGGFEVSSIVARQNELQSAVAEAAAVVRATVPDNEAQRTVIRDIVATSTGLTAQQVSITEVYRCGVSTRYYSSESSCTNLWWWSSDDGVSKYIKITVADTYVPIWTQFGVGSPLDYNVTRTILVG
jgi:Flp pilus assembly protein TadG